MKITIKSFIAAVLIATVGVTTALGAGGIKSSSFNSNKVILDGEQLNLGGQRMISVVKDGEQNASNYMPVRGVLESMGYAVEWDGQKQAVIVTSSPYGNYIPRPKIGETIDPTKELLSGAWIAIDDGYDDYGIDEVVKFYFDKNGKFAAYAEYGYTKQTTDVSGAYSIDKDIISMSMTYMEGETYTDDDVETLTLQCKFSKDGSRMYLTEVDYDGASITFAKDDGAEFVGKVEGFATKGIKSAAFNSNKMILDGKELDLGGQQMISVVKEGEQNASNYMPVRGVLTAMGYTVDWDGQEHAVIVSSEQKPASPKPIAEETIAPTKELLNGYWATTVYYDEYLEEYGDYEYDYGITKYYFDENGNFGFYYCYDDEYMEENVYAKGTYTINKDIVSIKITYMDYDGEKTTFKGDDIIELTTPIRFSKDGSKMFADDFDDEDVHITFVKDSGAEFKKYQ